MTLDMDMATDMDMDKDIDMDKNMEMGVNMNHGIRQGHDRNLGTNNRGRTVMTKWSGVNKPGHQPEQNLKLFLTMTIEALGNFLMEKQVQKS
jgi:hypothetical protein